MPTPPLSAEAQTQVLRILNKTAQDNPGIPIVSGNGKPSVTSIARKRVAAESGRKEKSVADRFKRTRSARPGEYSDACLGQWSDPGGVSAVTTFKTGVRRYLLTAAQNDTPVHAQFWANLQAYAQHLGAEISVGGFSYQLGVFSDHTARNQVFAEAVRPYLAHQQTSLGPVTWCAEMNVIPTAVRPLSGLETYTRGKFGVFPHAKIQLVSVPSVEQGGAGILCTTGACTIPNYIEKKAGLKAAFHHQIGATIVEIAEDGAPFMRQISATADDGAFQDLDIKVAGGKVSAGHRIEAITWGDIHREKLDPLVARASWGLDLERDEIVDTRDTMLDVLRPRHQFFHDLLDFEARNHHRRGDHAFLFKMVQGGTDKVEEGVKACSRFLRQTSREWCQSVVIPSNHNDAYPRWLREADPRLDPVNARFWFESNLEIYRAIERDDDAFDVFRWALSRHDERGLEDVAFPPRNSSYLICQAYGGIENIFHGDQGPNGARGTPLNLSKIALRLNTGHTHSASILDGVYTAGLSGLFEQGYNEGASSWSQSHTLTYANAKRTIVTLQKGRWRA